MDVPATRPEVATSGIYGEELRQMRQRLLRSDLSWCQDLTARTQVLIVGRVSPIIPRKLAAARACRLPCVSPSWVTEGACSLDATDAFDVRHELSGKEVCTTGLNEKERHRVQAVCMARCATYNPVLTRLCGLLVTPTETLPSTSPPASSSAAASAKSRYALKHHIWTMSLEKFVLRYDVTTQGQQEVASSGGLELRTSGMEVEGVDRQSLSFKRSRGESERDCNIRCMLPVEYRLDVKGDEASCSVPSSGAAARDVVVCASARTVTSTPRPSTAASASASENGRVLSAPLQIGPRDTWRNSACVTLSAIQPSLPSQLTAIAATSASLALSQSPRLLGDEFTDVVAYCSPPHCLTTEQHDLLTGMGVTIIPYLTPSTTHVLILGDTVEECLFPRPNLQIVSWRWVLQSQREQRRLSCAAFRLPLQFRPVVTFTGLSASDKHELVVALHRSGLPCDTQDALLLKEGNTHGGRATDEQVSARSLDLPGSSFVPRNTTHLVTPCRQILASPEIARLAQHCQQQHARRRPSSVPLASPLSLSASSCQLVDVSWICRSVRAGQWLEPEMFALAIPLPEAFALAAASRSKTTEGVSRNFSRTHATANPSAEVGTMPSSSQRRPSSQPNAAPPLVRASVTAQLSSPPQPSPHPHSGRSPSRGEVVVAELEEEEVEGAALSQHNTTTTTGNGETVQHGPTAALLTSAPAAPSFAAPRDEDDEEAGGESPSATAARRSALQVLHTSQPMPASQHSQAEQPASSSSSSAKRGSDGGGGEGVTEADKLAYTLQHTGNAGASHTYLGTQYSPTFENLLGELEAYPPGGVLGSALPFSAMGAPARPPPSVASLAGRTSDISKADESESVVYSPPQSSGPLAQQHGALQRVSLQRQHIPQRYPQQPQQQHSFTTGRTVSDESQVIFYQMGLGDHSAAPAPSSGDPQSRPQSYATGEALGSDNTSIVAATATASAAPAAVNAALTSSAGARDAASGLANSHAHSAATTAVFLITRDVLKGSGFDWDAFSVQIPRVQRTGRPEECTHFVTAKPSKTEQFLCCLAAGHWILTPAYLSACVAAGYLVKEDAFEWSAEAAVALGCRFSIAALVSGCKLQRMAAELPFAQWEVRVCCSSAKRLDSFVHVLRNGGCVALSGVSAEEVLNLTVSHSTALQVRSLNSEKTMVLADDDVFTEEQLERYAQYATVHRLCPILRLDYLVQVLCAPETTPSEANLLRYVQTHKRSRTETSSTR